MCITTRWPVHILRRVLALAIILAGLQSLVIVSAVDARATEIPCSADRTQPRCFVRTSS
jgi:hypothetical protein